MSEEKGPKHCVCMSTVI